ncbi:hypothetical protein ACFL18_01510 [Patescibacteria group bacterium]
MLKLKKYQQYVLGVLGSVVLFLIGFFILGISLFQENRQQAASIKQVTTDFINTLTD